MIYSTNSPLRPQQQYAPAPTHVPPVAESAAVTEGRPGQPFGQVFNGILVVTAFFLLLWGGVSLFHLARLCNVPGWFAWIPSVSTSGVMLLATAIGIRDHLEKKTKVWAWSLAGFGIFCDIVVAGGQHVIAMSDTPTTPHPAWGWAIGGLPPLMGGALVHVMAMAKAQHNRAKAATERAAQERAERADREAINAAAHERDLAAQLTLENTRSTNAIKESAARERAAGAEAAVISEKARLLAVETANLSAKAEADKQETARLREERRTAGQGGGQRGDRRADRKADNSGGQRGQGGGQGGGQQADRTAGPDVSDLLAPGRRVAAQLDEADRDLTRSALVSGLRSAGLSCSTARAVALLDRLKREQAEADGNGAADLPGKVHRLVSVAGS